MTNGSLMKDKRISEILLTCIKHLVLKTNFLSFWECPFYTSFTVLKLRNQAKVLRHGQFRDKLCEEFFCLNWEVFFNYDSLRVESPFLSCFITIC